MKVDQADMKLSNTQGGNEWFMAKDMGVAKGPGHYPGLSVAYNNTGDFTFTIHNPPNVTFAQTDPIQVQAGTTQPKGLDDQFTFTGAGTKVLVVHDTNQKKGDYFYELHFSNGSTLDPIITNGGCCIQNNQSYMLYLGLGLAALIAIFVLIIRPMLANQRAAAVKPPGTPRPTDADES